MRRGILWGVLAILSTDAGCHAKNPPTASTDQPVKRYTVRAEVVGLPPGPGGELTLRHESVPDFTDVTGAVVGMDAMVMPFPVASGVSLENLAPGAKVEMILSVDWAEGLYQIERIRTLPSDTMLRLGNPHEMGPTMKHEEVKR